MEIIVADTWSDGERDSWIVGDHSAVFITSNYGAITVSRDTFNSFTPAVRQINIPDNNYHEYRDYYNTGISAGDVPIAVMREALRGSPTPATPYVLGYASASPNPNLPAVPMLVHEGKGLNGTGLCCTNRPEGEPPLIPIGVMQRAALLACRGV